VNRVGGQTSRIVGIWIAAGDGEHALRQQLFQRVIDLARLPLVLQTGSQAGDQSVAPVSRLQQQGAAVRTAQSLVKPRYDALGENVGE
jgi:hypothetical protein